MTRVRMFQALCLAVAAFAAYDHNWQAVAGWAMAAVIASPTAWVKQ